MHFDHNQSSNYPKAYNAHRHQVGNSIQTGSNDDEISVTGTGTHRGWFKSSGYFTPYRRRCFFCSLSIFSFPSELTQPRRVHPFQSVNTMRNRNQFTKCILSHSYTNTNHVFLWASRWIAFVRDAIVVKCSGRVRCARVIFTNHNVLLHAYADIQIYNRSPRSTPRKINWSWIGYSIVCLYAHPFTRKYTRLCSLWLQAMLLLLLLVFAASHTDNACL